MPPACCVVSTPCLGLPQAWLCRVVTQTPEWQLSSLLGFCDSVSAAEPCARCEVVCVDATQGKREGPEPLLTLARYRRNRGRINFGLLMDSDSSQGMGHLLEVGMLVQPIAAQAP